MTAKVGSLKNPVRASWIRDLGCRLDAPPFVSGALEARKTLESLNVRKDSLADITTGIYHAGRESRRWVTDLQYGVPFLSSSNILESDLSILPLLSKKQIEKTPQFIIHEGWTLISRSGTIGKTSFARGEMDGMACSEHVMRVVPDEAKVLPGYLFAFISSKFGIPIVVSGTYGSIIQSIEPQHLATLPVPRFTLRLEKCIHEAVVEAAMKRSNAGKLRSDLRKSVESYIGWTERPMDLSPTCTSSLNLSRRLDGFYHGRSVNEARNAFRFHKDSKRLGDVVERVFEPNRGARKKVEDAAFGVPFLSSSAVFCIDPRAEYLVSNKTPHLESLILTERDVLLPRSGQLGGIIGRAVLPLRSNIGDAASEHLVRVRCKSTNSAHLAWAIFSTQPGYLCAIATAFGTSIPSLDCSLLSNLSIPWNEGSATASFIEQSMKIHSALDEAKLLERQAIDLVEQAIVENA